MVNTETEKTASGRFPRPTSVADVITITATASFVASCAFNLGYFLNFGYNIMQLLTLEDIAISALMWLPIFSFIVLIAYFSTGQEPPLHSNGKRTIFRWIGFRTWSHAVGCLYGLGVALVCYLIAPFGISWLIVLLLCLWMWGLDILAIRMHVAYTDVWQRLAVLLVPLTLLLVAFVGSVTSTLEIMYKHAPSVIHFEHGSETNIVVLRYLDRGVLFVSQSTGKVGLARWESIVSIDDVARQLPAMSRYCLWFRSTECTPVFGGRPDVPKASPPVPRGIKK